MVLTQKSKIWFQSVTVQFSKIKESVLTHNMQSSKKKNLLWPITMQFSKIKQPVSICKCAKNLPWTSRVLCWFFQKLPASSLRICKRTSDYFVLNFSKAQNLEVITKSKKCQTLAGIGCHVRLCSGSTYHLWLTLASGWIYPKFLCATTTKLNFKSHFDSLLQKL
jgi:hypothetical protein